MADTAKNQLLAIQMVAWICSVVASPGKTVMVFGVALLTGITIRLGVPVRLNCKHPSKTTHSLLEILLHTDYAY